MSNKDQFNRELASKHFRNLDRNIEKLSEAILKIEEKNSEKLSSLQEGQIQQGAVLEQIVLVSQKNERNLDILNNKFTEIVKENTVLSYRVGQVEKELKTMESSINEVKQDNKPVAEHVSKMQNTMSIVSNLPDKLYKIFLIIGVAISAYLYSNGIQRS